MANHPTLPEAIKVITDAMEEDKGEEGEAEAEVPELDEPKPTAPEVPEQEVHEDKTPAVSVPAEPELLPKVKVKDSEGNIQEFESLEEIPDDFEPFSYKEYGIAVGKLTERAIEQKQKDRDAEQARVDAETHERLTKSKLNGMPILPGSRKADLLVRTIRRLLMESLN